MKFHQYDMGYNLIYYKNMACAQQQNPQMLGGRVFDKDCLQDVRVGKLVAEENSSNSIYNVVCKFSIYPRQILKFLLHLTPIK
jgi:hypothetical protein